MSVIHIQLAEIGDCRKLKKLFQKYLFLIVMQINAALVAVLFCT